MKQASILGLGLLASIVALTSCTAKNQQQQLIPLLKDSQNIISTRPQSQTHIMAIVKLKSPALLEKSSREDGVTQIDQDLLKAIAQEQEEAIAELKKLSTDVQIVYRYKYVLNAVCVLAPKEILAKLNQIGLVASWESVGIFERPKTILSENVKSLTTALNERNSSKFIGAEKLNEQGLTGKGVRVGIIDTGIDFTHAMFKGVGTPEAYAAIDPAKEALGFPSDKVVGGVDLVGTHFDSASPDFGHRVPKPDVNPLDEGGHGTHVAGTVAGAGDGVNSYNGMAPDAMLYAIKVFGADGSTSDMVVIAALEYSVDPNGDDDLRDQLDVVNLSLGSGYGNPKILYSEAVKNLVNGGTVAVISAGNSGDKDYIVGAPGTSTEALSVAASIDNGDHNWKFSASEIRIADNVVPVEAMNAATTVPAEKSDVEGLLVHIGLANADLTDEQKAAVKGNVALIDRGQVTFNEKVKRAVEAGAIGVVLANNQPGAAFTMGTTDKFEIPAIMVTHEIGKQIKSAIQAGQSPSIKFKSDLKIEKPELIDTLTSFSSKGPRSIDGFLKPEISAPGSDIISADMGKGTEMVKLSGTSMAAPHVAGVMALIKQSYKGRGIELSALELKHVAMGTSKTIGDQNGRYAVTRQGAGRVQADVAAVAEFVASEPSISIGEMNIETRKTIRSAIHLRNLSGLKKSVTVEFTGSNFVKLNNPQTLDLDSDAVIKVNLSFTFDATKMQDTYVREMDGWILVKDAGVEVYRIPVLAVAHKLSAIQAQTLKVQAGKNDADGAAVTLSLKNESANSGEALLFNLLAQDERKPLSGAFMNADCDLESVGYRIVKKANSDGVVESYIQFGIKTYKPMTTWNSCDVSILVDADKDGIHEQEILGSTLQSIPGLVGEDFVSTVINAEVARAIRQKYEKAVEEAKNDPAKLAQLKDEENYTDAVMDQGDMVVHNNSTVVVVEARVASLKNDNKNQLNFKVVVSHNEQGSVQMDDHLDVAGEAFSVSLSEEDQAFVGLLETQVVNAKSSLETELTKGLGVNSLLILLPQNKFSNSDSMNDGQSIIIQPEFEN